MINIQKSLPGVGRGHSNNTTTRDKRLSCPPAQGTPARCQNTVSYPWSWAPLSSCHLQSHIPKALSAPTHKQPFLWTQVSAGLAAHVHTPSGSDTPGQTQACDTVHTTHIRSLAPAQDKQDISERQSNLHRSTRSCKTDWVLLLEMTAELPGAPAPLRPSL